MPPKADDPNVRSVEGIVIAENGVPVDGARVSVGDQIAITGPGGAYGFRDVDVPYDVVVRDGLRISAFVGLVRQRVILHTTGQRPLRAWSGRVDSLLPPAPAVLYLAEGTDVTGIEPAQGGIVVHWTGNYSQNVVLHAIAYDVDPTTRLPARYIGQSTFEGQLVPDEPSTWQGGFDAVDTTTMTLTPQIPAGYAQTSVDAVLDLGGTAQASLGTFPGSPAAILLPALPKANVHLHALATQGDAASRFVTRSIAVGTSHVDMPFAVAPAPVAPADFAVGKRASPAQDFTWTAPPGANQLFLVPESASDPTFVVTTSSTSATLDANALKTALPRGALYRWSVRHWEDTLRGVDQFACPGFDERTTRTATSARRTWIAPP